MAAPDPNVTRLDSAQLKALSMLANLRGVRKQSEYVFLGLPLYSIALGPDLAKGEWRGHAKGVFALGDVATGLIAVGGMAMGGVAIGGLALGLLTFGGLSVAVLLAVGGAAIGTVACGGGALGIVAIGGAVAGYYAAGGVAYGSYVIDAMRQSSEAIEFFSRWPMLQWLEMIPAARR
jgi:hypothetical protein